jgi:uncharacterized protein (DUF885 family)
MDAAHQEGRAVRRLAGPTAVAALAAAAAAFPVYPQDALQDASRRLNQLFQDYAVASRPLFPLFATANGWHEYNGQFSNTLSEEHREAERRYCSSHLERLKTFDRSKLGDADRLSHDVFEYNQRRCLDRLEQDLHLLPLDQGGFNLIATFPVWGSGKGPQPFRTVRDYDNFLQRIAGFVQWMDTAIANMRRGMARGMVQPRSATQEVLNQLGAMIVEDPKGSPFYEPIANLPADIAAEERKRLAAAYERAIRDQLVPAYRRVHAFVRDEYLPKARANAGLSGMPGGERLYAYYIRQQLTVPLTPEQMAETGRREMAKIRAQMEALKREAGFGGDLRAWAANLYAERPRYRETDEIIAKYRELHDRVQPQLGRLFAQLPRAGYDIRPVEAHREQGSPSQYWRSSPGQPGVFYVNLRGLKKEPAGVSELLFLHETLPGHHLQMALAAENTALPGFRRVGAHHAYVEGWAAYAETLGFDLGLYRDPYERLAFHNVDLGRAARIVTDVGLHAQGWTREQAIAFFLDNTLNAELYADYQRGVESMIDRDMVWPAYGPGYKIGQLKMLELRARAEAKLGSRFDLREFHGEILKDGSLPLPILEDKIDRWIATRLRSS